jgi:hypothetical protein
VRLAALNTSGRLALTETIDNHISRFAGLSTSADFDLSARIYASIAP